MHRKKSIMLCAFIVRCVFAVVPIVANAGSLSEITRLPFDSNIIEGKVPQIDELALPKKPSISVGRHLEKISGLSGGEVPVTRGAAGSLYKSILPTVVHVYTEEGTGSGVVVKDNGLLVTNEHVVGNNRNVAISFRNPSRGQIKDHRIFIADVVRIEKKWDLALLRLRDLPKNIKSITLGSLSEVEIGVDVYAIGHPKNERWTYTKGIVSQVRRGYLWGSGDHEADVIQTQTPINPGNSGGPLFTSDGVLIGINSFGDPKAEGINFAISVDHVKQLIDNDRSPKQRKNVLPTSIRSTAAKRYDTSKNGIDDLYCFDTDFNGRVDICAVDKNEDGKEEYWLLDLNENYEWDGMVVLESGPSGDRYHWYFDYDEDGTNDIEGLDVDADGEVDLYRPYSG